MAIYESLQRQLRNIFPECKLDSSTDEEWPPIYTRLLVPDGKFLYVFPKWKCIAWLNGYGEWSCKDQEVASKISKLLNVDVTLL